MVATSNKPALASINPDAYPALSREGVGILKFLWRKAGVADDWTKGGSLSEAWDRSTGFPGWKKPTYDLDYLTRTLAKVAQEVPAWREVCAETAKKATARWPQQAGWCDWVVEKGLDPNARQYPFFYYKHFMPPGYAGVYNALGYNGNGFNTAFDELFAAVGAGPRRKPVAEYPYYPQMAPATEAQPNVGRVYNPDPVYACGSGHMSYKGFLVHCVMLSYIISGDASYFEPMDFVYDEDIRFRYSPEEVLSILCGQHLAEVDPNGSPLLYGVDCEVGKTFPVCVSEGGLGAHLWDQVFGTNYRAGYDRWLGFATNGGIAGGETEPEGPFSWCCTYIDRDIPYTMNKPENMLPVCWVWPAFQMSPVVPEFAARIYEGAWRRYGNSTDDGLYLSWPSEISGPMHIPDSLSTVGALAWAHEFDDKERLEGIRAWVDAHYEPTHADGEFTFGFGFGESWPRGMLNHWAQLAYIGGPGSYRRLYHDINLEKFHQPTVSGVDYPNLYINRASYDPEVDALIVGTTPGVGRKGARTTFKVTNLSVSGPHEVVVDGNPYDRWAPAEPGSIVVETTVDDRCFVIR